MKNIQRFTMAVATIFMLLLSGCSLNLVSEYDERSLQNMAHIAQKIDFFYTRLSYLPSTERTFEQSKQSYVDVDVELNALMRRQKIRPLNELTVKQVEITRDLWLQDMNKHKQQNTVSDFILKHHRQQFSRLFIAMIKGEQSKPNSTIN